MSLDTQQLSNGVSYCVCLHALFSGIVVLIIFQAPVQTSGDEAEMSDDICRRKLMRTNALYKG